MTLKILKLSDLNIKFNENDVNTLKIQFAVRFEKSRRYSKE